MSRLQRPESDDPRDIAMFVDSRLDTLRGEIFEHIDRRFDEQRRLFMSAFLAEDAHAHKAWHQRQAESEADNRELRRSVTNWGAAGILGTLAGWNFEAIKTALRELFK